MKIITALLLFTSSISFGETSKSNDHSLSYYNEYEKITHIEKISIIDLPLEKAIQEVLTDFRGHEKRMKLPALKVTIISKSQEKVTLVVKNVSVKTLLEVLCEQSNHTYWYDPKSNTLNFAGITD